MRIFLLLLLIGCSSCIQYKSDSSFIPSAWANVAEFPVAVNGKDCKDIDGNIGSCFLSVKQGMAINIKTISRPYDFKMNITCTATLDLNQSISVPKNTSYEFTIPFDNYKNLSMFFCQAEIFPEDRPDNVSALWKIFVNITDPQYIPKEKIYSTGGVLVLGETSYWSTLDGKDYKKETLTRKNVKKAITESESMRFSYYESN